MESLGKLAYGGSDRGALQEELMERSFQLAALNAFAYSINRRPDLQFVAHTGLSELKSLVGYEWASVVLPGEQQSGRITCIALNGVSGEFREDTLFSIKGTPLAQCMESGRTLEVADLLGHDDNVSVLLLESGLRSCVAVPLVSEDLPIGVLSLARSSPGEFASRHLSVLEGAADHLANALYNATLYESVRKRMLELEALGSETRHRILNNLQMIAGLVNMIDTDSPAARRSVDKCLNQIKAISVIHETLCCDQKVETVTLRDTVERVAKMAAVATGGRSVCVEVDGDDTSVPSKLACVAAIAVNELVSNAIEHGLAGRDKGSIKIRITCDEQGTQILVSDDGVGLPQGFSLDDGTRSGLGVLSVLIKQALKGTLELTSDVGTAAKIFFKV